MSERHRKNAASTPRRVLSTMSKHSASGGPWSGNGGRGVSANQDSPLYQLSQSLRRAGHQRQSSITWGDLSKIRPESPPRFQLPITNTRTLTRLGKATFNSRPLLLHPQSIEKSIVHVERPKDSYSIKYPVSDTFSEGRQDKETGIWIDGQDVYQFAPEKPLLSPKHSGPMPLGGSANRLVIAQGLTHGWSNYIEVYRPMFRVHPSFHEPYWTSSYGFDHLRKSTPIEQLDLSTVWKGMSMSEAQELYHIEQVFEAHLSPMLADKLCNSSSSDYTLQAWESRDRSSHAATPRSTTIYMVKIEIQNLILDMIKFLCHGDRGLSRYQGPEYWRDRVLCYLATCDCLMETEPPSLHHVIMRTRIRHPKHSKTETIVPTIVEPAWNPDFLTFRNVDVAPCEGRELRILPEYRSFAKSRLDTSNVSISYSLGRSYQWLKWDEKLSGFKGNIPFYSDRKALDPILGEVSKSRLEGTNAVDNLLCIEVVAFWRKQVSPSIALEHTVRTRLNLRIVPWSEVEKLDNSVSASNLTSNPSPLATALITTPADPRPARPGSLTPQVYVEQYDLPAPHLIPPSVASSATESVCERLANLLDLDPPPSPAEMIPRSRSRDQIQGLAKSKVSGIDGASTDRPSCPLIESEDANRAMIDAIADAANMYDKMKTRDFSIESEEADRTRMDAIADAASMYDEMDSRNFLEASDEVCSIAQFVQYDGEMSDHGMDRGMLTPFSGPETPPFVMRYYNRFATLNDLRAQSDTLSIIEGEEEEEVGEDEVRFDSGSSTDNENDVMRSTPKDESSYRTDQSPALSSSSALHNTSTEIAHLQYGREVAYGYFLMSMDPGLAYEERENARLVYDMLMIDQEEKRASQNFEEPELTARLNAIINYDGSNDGFDGAEGGNSNSTKNEEHTSQTSSDGSLSLMDEGEEFGGAVNFGF